MGDEQKTQTTTEKVTRTVDPAGPSVTTERTAEQTTSQEQGERVEKASEEGSKKE